MEGSQGIAELRKAEEQASVSFVVALFFSSRVHAAVHPVSRPSGFPLLSVKGCVLSPLSAACR